MKRDVTLLAESMLFKLRLGSYSDGKTLVSMVRFMDNDPNLTEQQLADAVGLLRDAADQVEAIRKARSKREKMIR